MHNLLRLLFLHVISKFVQTHLKQYVWHKFSVRFTFFNDVVRLIKVILMRCILITTYFIQTSLKDSKFIKYVQCLSK